MTLAFFTIGFDGAYFRKWWQAREKTS